MSAKQQVDQIQSNSVAFINSADRFPNELPENFNVDIDTSLGNQVQAIALAECIIPASYYRINNTNNIFNLGISGVYSPVTIPPGNYTITNFIGSAGQLALSLNTVTPGVSWTSAYNTITGTMSVSNSISEAFSFESNYYNNSYLGMGVSAIVSSVGGILVSPNPLDLSGTKYIELRTNMNMNSSTTINYDKGTLARIPTNSTAFGIISYTAESFKWINSQNKYYQNINLRLFDDRQEPLSLNNLDYNCTLIFHS
jgi:hypothetical protein